MKKGSIGAGFLGIVMFGSVAIGFACAERVPTGYVGVQYSMTRGVEDEILEEGWHIISPTKKIKEFTIGNEQLILTKDSRDGSEEDESFKVATADDASIAVSFQMSYRYKSDDVVNTYKKFKGMDGEAIVNSRVKTVLKSKVSEVTTDYSMMDIYSGNRSEINNKITDYLNEEFSETYGIEVIDASIIDVHPDEKLRQAIDNRVTALQKKQQAEAEQETIKVEAQTKLIEAENKAAIKVKEAEAKAEAKLIETRAEAEANRELAASLTPELIEKIKYEKWSGNLPEVMGSNGTIIDLTN